jgi:hypothetical protein
MNTYTYTRMDLDNFQNYPESKSSYLDGRYFNQVFNDFPGLLKNPLYITIKNDKVDISMNNIIHYNDIHLIRAIVTSENNKKLRHCVLIIINNMEKNIIIYDPDANHPDIHELILDEIVDFFNNEYNFIDIEAIEPPERILPNCHNTGVCNALVILYAYRYIMNEIMTIDDIINIRKFMYMIETKYILPVGDPDIEYLTGQDALLTGTGALAGGLIGAPLGSGGVVAGAAIGELGGYALSRGIKNDEYDRYNTYDNYNRYDRYNKYDNYYNRYNRSYYPKYY